MIFLVVSYHLHLGVAQLVARLTGGQEAAGSSPVTPTKKKTILWNRLFQFYSPIGELYCHAVILCFA